MTSKAGCTGSKEAARLTRTRSRRPIDFQNVRKKKANTELKGKVKQSSAQETLQGLLVGCQNDSMFGDGAEIAFWRNPKCPGEGWRRPPGDGCNLGTGFKPKAPGPGILVTYIYIYI